jgi:SAM-dependent methyltransferase
MRSRVSSGIVGGMSAYIDRNRDHWNRDSATYQATHGSQLGVVEPTWGVWAIPERELGILGDVADKDVLELGCGGAQWSIALARRGARVTGLDLSAAQLAHARALIARERVDVRLIEANAEATGLPDRSFDVVFCDHGAMAFADPRRTVPEVARLLRPGGLFAFNGATPLLYACLDVAADVVDERLRLDYFGLHAIDAGGTVTFQLPYGEWIRLFRAHRLAIEDLVEIRPPADAATTYVGYVPLQWARRWPAEHVWKLRKE